MENVTCDYKVRYDIYAPKGKKWHKILVIRDTDKYTDIVKSVETLIATNNRFKVMVGHNTVLHFNGRHLSTMFCVDCYKAYKINKCSEIGCCLIARICNGRKYDVKTLDGLRKECKL